MDDNLKEMVLNELSRTINITAIHKAMSVDDVVELYYKITGVKL